MQHPRETGRREARVGRLMYTVVVERLHGVLRHNEVFIDSSVVLFGE